MLEIIGYDDDLPTKDELFSDPGANPSDFIGSEFRDGESAFKVVDVLTSSTEVVNIGSEEN
jgi:hypothetical protein